MSHFVRVCHELGEKDNRNRNKENTWSTCCVLLSELVSLLQLVKPSLIYVLRQLVIFIGFTSLVIVLIFVGKTPLSPP